MTNTIGSALAAVVEPIVPLYLAEAETKKYPYAVYDITSVPMYTKDGCYKIQADVAVKIVSNSAAEMESYCQLVDAAIISGMNVHPYLTRHERSDVDCLDGVWTKEINYTINQYQ